ncbi:MAG: hypothetical protein WC641_05035 [Patescibacteria group bacterium]
MTWLDKAAAFLAGGPKSGDASRAFKSAACASTGKKNKLALRQRDLAERLEELFRAYEERMEELAQSIRSLDEGCSEAEAERIKGLQESMRQAFLRLDAASRPAQDLKRDLMYWQNREDEAEAQERIEILGSELALRGEKISVPRETIKTEQAPAGTVAIQLMEQRDDILPASSDTEDSLYLPEEEYLLCAIREATHEAERWHAIPVTGEDEDALIQVHHVRELNGALKEYDRKRGVSRDRLPLAIRLRVLN